MLTVKAKYKNIKFNCIITEEELLFNSIIYLVKKQFKQLYPDIKIKDHLKIIGYEINI